MKRKIALAVATLAVALGAGHLVQEGRTFRGAAEPATTESPGRPSDIVVLSSSGPARDRPLMPGAVAGAVVSP